jgi:hypothetical protein
MLPNLQNLQNKNVDYLLNMIFNGIWPLNSTIWQPCITLSISQKPVLKTQFLLHSLPHHLKLSNV